MRQMAYSGEISDVVCWWAPPCGNICYCRFIGNWDCTDIQM